MIDHTNMRNELVNEFAKDIGMEYAVSDTDVVLILNGEYQGIYELAEHLRVASDRVNVFDWEDLAGTIAKKISKKDASVNEDALKTAMEQDYSWLNGSFTFQNKTYQIADYYKDTIPEVTGGFMLDMVFGVPILLMPINTSRHSGPQMDTNVFSGRRNSKDKFCNDGLCIKLYQYL